MSKWKNAFKKFAHKAENKFDELSDRLTYRLGLLDKIHVVVYHSYASDKSVTISGRVLEDREIKPASDEDSKWQNLLNTYKRLGSNEIPDALLAVTIDTLTQKVRSDEEGYFHATFPLANPMPYTKEGLKVRIELLDFPVGAQINAEGNEGHIFLTPPEADFGIISDIDDTIMKTGATNLLKMAWATFMQNAHTRIAFKGVANFYQALQKGPALDNCNPFFYVSSSPWNLFDLIDDFIEINEIPKGPLLLRDYGIDESKLLVTTHGQHKRQAIEQVLQDHPTLPFILIGDSGQEDAFIYSQIARDFPNRILAIYIRDAQVEGQTAKVLDIIHKANTDGIEMLLVPDSLIAARHAVSKGLIHPDILPDIEAEIIDEQEKDEELDKLLASK